MSPSIYIKWSHAQNRNPQNWQPNHFVVCFPNLFFIDETNFKSKTCQCVDSFGKTNKGMT